MTKSVRIIALVLVLAACASMLVSCGKTLKGSYVLKATDIDLGDLGSNKTTVVFRGNKFTETTVTTSILGDSTVTVEGTYKIQEADDGDWEIIMTVEKDGKEVSETLSFEELENGDIKIGGVTYEKQD